MQNNSGDSSSHYLYHFFGNLWLESPEEYLSTEELGRLRTLEPLIHDLESQQRSAARTPFLKTLS
jgi:hypothetical protein